MVDLLAPIDVCVDLESDQPFSVPEGIDPKEVRFYSPIPPGTQIENVLSDVLEAPEEELVPTPCSFPDHVYYMEMSVAEAESEYLELLPSRICEGMLEHGALELLQTLGLRVFVPNNWEGIRGLEIELEFREDMPKRMKPRARPVPPKLKEPFEKEITRMLKYMYRVSYSAVASCLVLAHKDTPPGIRVCGDYRGVNEYIVSHHYPMPQVIHELHKLINFTVFIEMDLANAYHQLRLGPRTSAMLSVQTTLGQFEPMFMPEGVGPAMNYLQAVVRDLFGEFDEWMVIVFDNLLICAHDYADATKKLKTVLERCLEVNLFLKLKKSWFGILTVEFFGYLCNRGSYRLTKARQEAVTRIPFPSGDNPVTQMQRFLGSAVYFRQFIPNYSDKVHLLHDMTHKKFSWDESTWTQNYRAAFEAFKKDILRSFTLFHPDYSLVWILRTDASDVGCGAVLMQVFVHPDGTEEYQVIVFISHKFTDAATRWNVMEKECFGVFFGVKKLSYYLRGKHFFLETDHANLLWMQQSEVPKIIRQRIFLQGFDYTLRHIKGKDNVVADWQSRLFLLFVATGDLDPVKEFMSESVDLPEGYRPERQRSLFALLGAVEKKKKRRYTWREPLVDKTSVWVSPDELISQVHNSRVGHHGVTRTWGMLNREFPGHRVTQEYVAQYINSRCSLCQKLRLGMGMALPAPIRSIRPSHYRELVGVDTLKVTPPDKEGHVAIHVVRRVASRLVGLYPVKDESATGMATAIFLFCVRYGLFDVLLSDPGSNITAEVVQQLLTWFGITHRVSLVDRHESNFVEPANREILRLLSALVHEQRIVGEWGSPINMGLVENIINSQKSYETGISPYHLEFGTEDVRYFDIPAHLTTDKRQQAFVARLDEKLAALRKVAKQVTEAEQEKRGAATPAHAQNEYAPGALVLFNKYRGKHKPSKLTPKHVGPYEVVATRNADVSCKHLVTGHRETLHMEWLKPFFGTREDAYETAKLDHDQFLVKGFLAHRGDPNHRTTMEFEVEFESGEVVWLTWSQDLYDTVQYEEYCRAHRPLYPLIFKANVAAKMMRDKAREPIRDVEPGLTCYVDLRFWGAEWYRQMALPDKDHTLYVVECTYGDWKGSGRKKIQVHCPIFNGDVYTWTNYDVYAFGFRLEYDPESMILVDRQFVSEYPRLME